MSTTHPYGEVAPLYALGVLDDAERAEFEAHLAGCEQCREEVREMGEVVGMLANAVPSVSPPAGLRDRILTEARQSPRASRNSSDDAGSAAREIHGSASDQPSGDPAGVHPLRAERSPVGTGSTAAPRQARASWAPWLVMAASLIIAVVAGLGFLQEREARLAIETDLRATEANLSQRDDLIASVLGADVRVARLTVDGEAPRMQLFWNQQRGVLVLSANNLPPAPAGRVYQLWGIPEDGAPISLGTFNSQPDGTTTAVLSVPDAPLAVSAVTEEPQGGSPQPTTTPFLVGAWSGEAR